MKRDIHPRYYQSTLRCSCGNTFITGSTKKELKVEVCSQCHPLFTGVQKIIDTAGQVEKFYRRYKHKTENNAEKKD